ncbi:phosphoenolpyruvate synthase [Mycobacterium sp. C31M]
MTILIHDRTTGDPLCAAAGGKARNLFALTAAGFPVPTWSVLVSNAFQEVLAASGVQLSRAPLSLAERLTEAAAAESTLRTVAIPAAIRAAINSAVEYAGNGAVAVRSSADTEDGAMNSFAGLFDTILNVRGMDSVEDAVRRCWASAFSPRATQYRYARGLDPTDVALAVIVQRFIRPSSSGVLFTADPVTGSTLRMVISGVLGLGEGLVSGSVDADTVIVDKRTGCAVEVTIADKQQMVAAADAGGVRSVAVPEPDRSRCCVDTAELTRLGQRLEQHFGGPQDVEWSVVDDTVWVLQSRPITTIAGDAEHLGEPVVPGTRRIWDNSNIIESFAGVTSPLTFTTARTLYADVYRSYARSMRVGQAQLDQMEQWLPVMLGQFNGHVYYNLLHWYRMVGIAPGYPLNRRVLEIALGVGEPLDPATARTLRPFSFANPLTRLRSRCRTQLTYLRSFRDIDRLVAEFDVNFHGFIDRHGLADVSGMDGATAHRKFCTIHDEVADIWGPMMVLDAILLTSVGLLATMTKLFLPNAPEWFGFAVVNPGADVVSIEPARMLADIAGFVRADPELRSFVETVDPAVAYDRLAQWPELQRRIDTYIDRFGFRCVDELKLETPDLREDPSGIFVLLRADLAGERPADAAQEYLDTHLHGLRRKLFDALRAKVQRAATHREHLRFCRTQGFGILKSLITVMAADLAERGIINARTDVFLLRRDELFGLYEGSVTAATARAAITRRRTLDAGYRTCKAPARFTTTGSDYAPEDLARAGWRTAGQAGPMPAGTVLTGTPSSPGQVTGQAVVVERPEDFTGGILVAYRTDPGWVAALPFASALLIERASPLTHVAIIARELGVPTVVQIDGLTDTVRTGMTVSVDGAAGRVVLLEEVAVDA